VLLQQLDVVDGHAAVHRLAHVVDGEQGHIDGGEGFHFDPGGADSLYRCRAKNACSPRRCCVNSFEFDSNASQRERVTERNQLAGFLGALNPGNAGDAQHITFFGAAGLDDGQGGWQHVDAATGHRNPVGAGLAGHVDHVGLALGVKMREGIHGLYRTFINFKHHTGMQFFAQHAHRTRLAMAVLAAALGAVPVTLSYAQTNAKALVPASSGLPTLGDGSAITLSAERRMGDGIAREIYRDPDYVDDPILLDYVENIWQRLLAAARTRGELPPELDERFAWKILLVRDRTVNAFALPGGYFGMHLGLLGVVASRDELASVMAHELSHVTQRHISRLIAKQGQQTPWMIGTMILAVLAASKSAQAANAMIVGSQALAVQNQLNYSRDMEREADRVGFGVMTQAGFAPQGFTGLFEKLQQASRLNDNGSFPYLRSHPLTTERIADMQARQAFAPAAPAPPLVMEHAMLAARARVLSNPGVDSLHATMGEGSSANLDLANLTEPKRAAALYGAALASTQLRDFAAATTALERLTKLTGSDERAARLARLASAELALANNDAARALLLAPALGAGPVARPEILLAARAQLRVGQNFEAAQALQLWVTSHPGDAQAWQLLSGAYAAQGQKLRAIRAEAEAQVALLDYAGAMDRFRAAQDLVRKTPAGSSVDHIDASIIDTRTREIQLLLTEQAAER
jgi:predicted Zn-dependent protease